jgi:hypothetical protein
MKKLDKAFRIPSAAYTLTNKVMKNYIPIDRAPKIGDVVYGQVKTIGQHHSLENSQGRIHTIHAGTKAAFVFGNRYAPDYYEGILPENADFESLDLLARSGVVGKVISKSGKVISPTTIKPLGYICDANGKAINTLDYSIIKPKSKEKKYPRAKMILAIGTELWQKCGSYSLRICTFGTR